MSLLTELKRRKVFKVGAGYLVVAWLAVQAVSIAFPAFDAPPWALRAFILLALLGFPFALVMAWLFDATPEGMKLDATCTGSKGVFAAAAVLAALALGWYFHGQPAPRPGQVVQAASVAQTGAASAPPAAAPAPESNSIAVLPFVDMSQTHDQEYFSDGLSEELLNLLAQLPQMRVIARTSSFSFKGKEVDVATIARTLNVANVLEGSVRKSGNTLRITAQLIRASDSSHLWSQTYDRELTDVFKVQDEIAGEVVAALKVKLLPSQQLPSAQRTSNTEAYRQYLLGNQFSNRENLEDDRRAEAAYTKAIALDPGYAAAMAALAGVQYFIADASGDGRSGREQALATADRAIALDPTSSDGYAARGVTRLSFSRDWAGAQSDLEKAVALNAGSSRAQVGYWRLLMAKGRPPEALVIARRAVELDPLSSIAWDSLGRVLNADGQLAAGRKALERSLEISPASSHAHFTLGVNYLLDGKAPDALVQFQQAGPGYRQAGMAMAEHSLGHARESQAAIDEGIAQFGGGAAYQIAEAFAWRGDKDKAFEWLDRAFIQNDGGLTFTKVDPLLANVKADPRFATLLGKLGLPE